MIPKEKVEEKTAHSNSRCRETKILLNREGSDFDTKL